MQHGNPLFPTDNSLTASDGTIELHPEKHLEPAEPKPDDSGMNAALALIRDKLASIYAEAPDPLAEANKAAVAQDRSKHQTFMLNLQTSGKSLAEIQSAWHTYYAGLADHEKHEVWQEFYVANARMRQPAARLPESHRTFRPPLHAQPQIAPQPAPTVTRPEPPTPAVERRTAQQLRQAIQYKVTAGGRLRVHHHLQSLGFGLAIGVVTLVITLFSFFNEVVIAPFIQPGRAEGATPIIIDPSSVATGDTPEVIIPKINLEIPVDYTQTSNDEAAIQNALENGIVHYPSTVLPGQTGNAAFFGHSSNNIFNPGKYKFAFVLLHELQPGDTFYLTFQGKSYVYKVFQRIVVEPDNVSVLGNVAGHAATATLITCDPPGTALHRLIIVGDQISPDPAANIGGQNTINTSSTTPTTLPDNGPSLWDNITRFLHP